MDNQAPSHPLEHKLAAPMILQPDFNYPAAPELPHLSAQRNVLGEGQPSPGGMWNGKGPPDINVKQENGYSCTQLRRDAPNTLQIHKLRKPEDGHYVDQAPMYLSPQGKHSMRTQRTLLPPLSSCVSGSNTDLDDISAVIPPIHSLSPYLGSGISEVPSFPSLLSPHSSTHHLQRKRALSSSPHSDMLSDLYGIRSSPNSLHPAAVFPGTPNGQVECAGQPPNGLLPHYRLQRQKTSIEQNQNLDGSTDTTITNKITYTEHKKSQVLRYNLVGNESNLAAVHHIAPQPVEYYDPISPRSISSVNSHSTQQKEDVEPYVCLWEGCGQCFEEQDDLVRHIENKHVEKGRSEDFTCLWKSCIRKRKPFNARYKLLIHMRIHSGEKPNKCMVSCCLCTV